MKYILILFITLLSDNKTKSQGLFIDNNNNECIILHSDTLIDCECIYFVNTYLQFNLLSQWDVDELSTFFTMNRKEQSQLITQWTFEDKLGVVWWKIDDNNQNLFNLNNLKE